MDHQQLITSAGAIPAVVKLLKDGPPALQVIFVLLQTQGVKSHSASPSRFLVVLSRTLAKTQPTLHIHSPPKTIIDQQIDGVLFDRRTQQLPS